MIPLLAIVTALAVNVPLVTLDELEQRLQVASDTVYVVNFWATWCKPCVAELPVFDKLDRETRGTPVKVLLVSLDNVDDVQKVATFVTRRGLVPEVMLLNESKPHEWIDRISTDWSGAIPATMLYHASTKRKSFYEREFTYEALTKELSSFTRTSP